MGSNYPSSSPIRRSCSAAVSKWDRHHETSTLHAPTDFLTGLAENLREEVKAALEAFVADSYLRFTLGHRIHPDDPFNSVFISALKPDPLLQVTRDRVQALWNIRDLSEQITFVDGWDD